MYCSTCFGRFHAHHQEITTALKASGFTFERGGSSVVGRGLFILRLIKFRLNCLSLNVNTLQRTGDADLRFYVTTVQEG